jgi:putative MATE family efflux protein
MDSERDPTSFRRSEGSAIIVSGRIWRAVWYVAWPTVINTTVLMAYNLINRWFLGQLPDSTPAQAAIGLGGGLLMLQASIAFGLSAGAAALVSRFLGANEIDNANEASRQSLILAAVIGVVSSLPLIIAPIVIVKLVGAKGSVVGLAADYTAINAYFSAPVFVYFIGTTVLRAVGDVRSTLYCGLVAIVLNIVFDYLLVLGAGPFPQLGVVGAAWGTGASRLVALLAIWMFLRRSAVADSVTHLRLNLSWFVRITNVGWPASIQNVLWTTAGTGFVWVLGQLPGNEATDAQAAYSVGLVLESLAFMPGLAYGIAATPLVGQNLGAGRPDRAEHSAWVATGQAAMVMGLVAVVFWMIPQRLAAPYNPSPAVLALIVSYLRINALAEPLLAVNMTLRGALQGAGDTRIPAWITFITNWLVRMPLAYVLAITLRHGAVGAWYAMSISTALSGLLIAIWFKWGTWRTQHV